MANPRDLSKVCLQRATTNPSSNHPLQDDQNMRYPLPMRKVTGEKQTYTKAAGSSEIDHRTYSHAGKGRKIQTRQAEDKFALKGMTYTIKPTTSPTVKAEPGTILPFHVGDIVSITGAEGTGHLALISETTSFHDAQIAIVCVWLYTRADISDDMVGNGVSCDAVQEYLHSMWPVNETNRSQFDYMLSTKRTIAILGLTDTFVKPVTPRVATRFCRNAIYHANSSERRICDVDEVSFSWLKGILRP